MFSHPVLTPRAKISLFYLLALAPLPLIFYYDLWSLIIAFYGFLFLFLKSNKLQSFDSPSSGQKVLGVVAIIGSFFVYYLMIKIVPTAAFYGGANYFVFVSGLFLVFFDMSALREAFTPLFFIAAGNSIIIVADLLKPSVSPYLGNIASLIVNVLRTIGLKAYMFYGGITPIIAFNSQYGNLVLAAFVYECVGVFSALLFSIILMIVLFEDPSSPKVRIAATIIGVSGTFALNILRITLIFVTDYFYGMEAGANVHYVIGYVLFSAWLGLFLYVYYKRKTIQNRIQLFFHRADLTKT